MSKRTRRCNRRQYGTETAPGTLSAGDSMCERFVCGGRERTHPTGACARRRTAAQSVSQSVSQYVHCVRKCESRGTEKADACLRFDRHGGGPMQRAAIEGHLDWVDQPLQFFARSVRRRSVVAAAVTATEEEEEEEEDAGATTSPRGRATPRSREGRGRWRAHRRGYGGPAQGGRSGRPRPSEPWHYNRTMALQPNHGTATERFAKRTCKERASTDVSRIQRRCDRTP
jgi:hypothetical protein